MARRLVKNIAAAAAGGGDSWIVCDSYTLTIKLHPACIFQLDVQDAAGNPYHFRVLDPNQKVGFVQKILRVLADRWPSFAFEFKANTDGEITDVQ